MQDATAADRLFEQPTVFFGNASGALVNVSASGKHMIAVSLVEGTAGAEGDALQAFLTGTRTVAVVDGVARFTDLGIAREAQGLRFKFTVLPPEPEPRNPKP